MVAGCGPEAAQSSASGGPAIGSDANSRRSRRPFYGSIGTSDPSGPLASAEQAVGNMPNDDLDPRFQHIADVRDGLTREERVVLYVLHQTQKERGDRNVPTAMLWGRVCEYFYISPEALSEMVARLGARTHDQPSA